jgi:outer membrane protein TolC
MHSRLWFLAGVLVLAVVVSATGCSPGYYALSADNEVYAIISVKSRQVPGMPDSFTIDQEQTDVLEGCPVAAQPPSPIEGLPEAEVAEDGQEQGPAVQISLIKALEIASRNSRDYQSRKETLYLRALSLTLARYAFDPHFFGSADGDLTVTPIDPTTDMGHDRRIGLVTDLGFSWLFRTGTQITVSLASSFSKFLTGDPREAAASTFNVTITQPLLRGAGIAVTEPLTQAEFDVIYEIRDFVRFRRDFFVGILTDYYRILERYQVLVNEELNYKNLTTLQKRTEALADAGELPGFESDQARQQTLTAANSVLRARQDYENSLDSFKVRLGIRTEARVVLNQDDLNSLTIEDVAEVRLAQETVEQIAVDHRLDLLNLCDQVDDAQRKVEVAANDLLPGLDLGGGLGIPSEPVENRPFDFRTDLYDYSVGFELDLPLDRKSERNTYRRRLIELASAQRNYSERRDQIVSDVRSAYRQYVRARKTYEIAEVSLQLAQERWQSTNMLLDAGRALVRDVLDAQESLLGSQNALASALVDYKVASLALARDMDILIVGDNGELEENFDAYE